jgi:hypothetical protein
MAFIVYHSIIACHSHRHLSHESSITPIIVSLSSTLSYCYYFHHCHITYYFSFSHSPSSFILMQSIVFHCNAMYCLSLLCNTSTSIVFHRDIFHCSIIHCLPLSCLSSLCYSSSLAVLAVQHLLSLFIIFSCYPSSPLAVRYLLSLSVISSHCLSSLIVAVIITL